MRKTSEVSTGGKLLVFNFKTIFQLRPSANPIAVDVSNQFN
jgi:hypothetical protein